VTSRSLLWKGSAALVGGRLSMSAGRLVAAVLVGRLAGLPELGAFTMLLSLIAIFEWVADFGQTDIAVREISRSPHSGSSVLAALRRCKIATAAALPLAMPMVAAMVDGVPHLVPATAIASLGVAALALSLPDRVLVRVALRPWINVAAELGGFVLFLAAIAVAASKGAPLTALAVAYVLFRVSHALILHRLSPRSESSGEPSESAMRMLVTAAIPLGAAGLLVALYDNIAALLLGRMTDLRSVGEFAAAARFAFPVVMIVQAITTAFFPALAAEHGREDKRLAALQQNTLDASILSAGAMFVVLHAASDFLVGLISSDITDAAPLLRLLAWLVLARAVTTAMSPLVIIGGRQALGLVFTCLSLALQVVAILLLVPRMGIIGVGWGYLLVELTLGVIPVSILGLKATGIRLDWGRPVAVVACAAIVAIAVQSTSIQGKFTGGVAAGLLFVGAIAVSWLWKGGRGATISRIMADLRPSS
jgi:O-antigen/teichoic acid export membrane protein